MTFELAKHLAAALASSSRFWRPEQELGEPRSGRVANAGVDDDFIERGGERPIIVPLLAARAPRVGTADCRRTQFGLNSVSLRLEPGP